MKNGSFLRSEQINEFLFLDLEKKELCDQIGSYIYIDHQWICKYFIFNFRSNLKIMPGENT